MRRLFLLQSQSVALPPSAATVPMRARRGGREEDGGGGGSPGGGGAHNFFQTPIHCILQTHRGGVKAGGVKDSNTIKAASAPTPPSPKS